MSKFYRIGENLNVVTKVYGQAMKERNPKPLQELALREAEAGVDFIDVNIGPARKGGEELMEWIVKIIQEVVTLTIFAVFAVLVLKEPIGWRYLGAFACILGAACFMFVGRP